MTKTPTIVFLFDVDNTLLDNDRVQADLSGHLEEAYGSATRDRYWGIFEELRQYFLARPDVTAAELYAEAERCAEASGWLFGGAIAGHIVGEFPHARIPGDKDMYRISPANTGRMRDPDAVGNERHWIIEVHLVDRARTFGGFYERLLQPETASAD